jgi:hypothetical protein
MKRLTESDLDDAPNPAAAAQDEDSHLAAYLWERLGLLCTVAVVFVVLIVFVEYKYLHSSFTVIPNLH